MSSRNKSRVTLDGYTALLMRASKEGLPPLGALEETEFRMVWELLEAGLLSDARTTLGAGPVTIGLGTVITPEGAIVLAQWSAYIKESSLAHKVLVGLSKIFWLLVGALCVAVADLASSYPWNS